MFFNVERILNASFIIYLTMPEDDSSSVLTGILLPVDILDSFSFKLSYIVSLGCVNCVRRKYGDSCGVIKESREIVPSWASCVTQVA